MALIKDVEGLDTQGAARMTVRQVPFDFLQSEGHWNRDKPEFSQIVNAASLAMPHLEPYLIRTMRQAKSLITDPDLQNEVDLYIKQEATHYKQHRRFNDKLIEAGYQCIAPLEDSLAADYSTLGKTRSLKFNLAYAEGFESMALALGQMLIEDREYLFGNSDSSVASLVLWHFVEEIEHKNVTFDAYHHLYGGYFWRIFGLLYATGHIFLRVIQGYRALLREDGLWTSFGSRLQMTKLIFRLLGNIAPKWLRIWKPGYHPSTITDPEWGKDWAKLYSNNPDGVARLDTYQLSANSPVMA
ncbi:MAG: putative metal-dependent hydrolase [Flavobacterium sp.]|jgi:predicted metal-dependent hydrolase